MFSPWICPSSHRQTSRAVLFRVKQHYVAVFFQPSEDTALASLPLAHPPNVCHTPAWPLLSPQPGMLSLALWFCQNATSSEQPPADALSLSYLLTCFMDLCSGDDVSVCAVHLHQQDVSPLRVAFCFSQLSWFRAWKRARFSNICQMNGCGALSRKHFPLDLLLFLSSHFLWSLKVLT